MYRFSKKQLIFLFLFSILRGFGQDSAHVSAYLKDSYFVYPFQIQAGYSSEIYKGFKYIQNYDNKIIINNQYDSLDDFRKNLYIDNKEIQEYVTNIEKQLDIQEIYYDKGIVISDNHFSLVK